MRLNNKFCCTTMLLVIGISTRVLSVQVCGASIGLEPAADFISKTQYRHLRSQDILPRTLDIDTVLRNKIFL